MSDFRKPRLLALSVALITLALLPTAARAQGNVSGTIAGNVTDASGAAIADATVTLTNLGTAAKRTIQSGASGEYTFVSIQPGQYRIEGEKSGFKKFVREPGTKSLER